MALRRFELRSGDRTLSVCEASSAHEALKDFMRGLGCHESEISRLGDHSAAWRGAVYSALPASDDSAPTELPAA
jgi:hypothetical protein